MYDNDYVRLTALRRDAMLFSPTLRIGLKARIISAPSRKGGVYQYPDLVRRAEGLN